MSAGGMSRERRDEVLAKLDILRSLGLRGPFTQKEIAQLLGITRGGVSMIEKRAMKKLSRLVVGKKDEYR